jgi:hypothetical protein
MRNWKDLEGSTYNLSKELSWLLQGEKNKNHGKLQSR